MSRIDELIAELCPNGVEFEELGKLLAYEQPTRYLVGSTAYNDSFATPVLTAGQTFVLGRTDEKSGIYPASAATPVIIFDDFTTAFKWVDFPFKAKSSAMKMLTPKDPGRASLRYIYYVMQTIRYQPQDHARQWIGVYSGFQVPVPPLEVQREFVRILDEFTALEAELEAELEARRKQYEHYRVTLLSKSGKYPICRVEDVAHFFNAKAHEKLVHPEGTVALMTARFISRGEADRYVMPEDVLTPAFEGDVALVMSDLPNGRALARTFFVHEDGKFAANQRVCLLRSKDPTFVNPKYLFYVLNRNEQLLAYDSGVDQTHLKKDYILNVTLEAPPLDEQNRIVESLDVFNALISDISIGLPAEIAARRKQYEYYRDKLLTFKELTT